MLASTLSGSMPWLMVRFPCGSRSIASTRLPDSAKATARLRVVVVLATPPFWLAKEMIWARRSDSSPMWAPGTLPLPGWRDGASACSALMRPSSSGSGSARSAGGDGVLVSGSARSAGGDGLLASGSGSEATSGGADLAVGDDWVTVEGDSASGCRDVDGGSGSTE